MLIRAEYSRRDSREEAIGHLEELVRLDPDEERAYMMLEFMRRMEPRTSVLSPFGPIRPRRPQPPVCAQVDKSSHPDKNW